MFQPRRPIIMALCLLAALYLGGIDLAQAAQPYSPDMLAVQGSWVRTDAPYVIGLRSGKDASLQASYFNQKPINVEKTEISEQDGLLQIMILLQDVNYQGSYYLLGYDRTRDALQGRYFHAGSQQLYEVGFTRQTSK